MRIDIHAVNVSAPEGLRSYAEKRLWQAARHWQRRVAWVGLWLVDRDDPSAQLSCRLDAWVSGAGIVTVRHHESNPFVAVDIAAARLEQAIERKMRELARRNLREALRTGAGHPTPPAARRGPRLALVLERKGLPRRLSIQPWLRAKYGVERALRIGLPAHLWHAASEDNGLADELRYRLEQTLHGKPELIVVLGRANHNDGLESADEEQDRVRRIGEQLRTWDLPVEIVTLWISETWRPDAEVLSMELSRLPHRNLHDGDQRAPAVISAMDVSENEVMSCA